MTNPYTEFEDYREQRRRRRTQKELRAAVRRYLMAFGCETGKCITCGEIIAGDRETVFSFLRMHRTRHALDALNGK